MNEREALLTGAMMGAFMRALADGSFTYSDVRPVIDDKGNYSNAFTVSASDGARFKVTIQQVES